MGTDASVMLGQRLVLRYSFVDNNAGIQAVHDVVSLKRGFIVGDHQAMAEVAMFWTTVALASYPNGQCWAPGWATPLDRGCWPRWPDGRNVRPMERGCESGIPEGTV